MFLISTIGHQTEGKQMKYVLDIAQINPIKVYFQIHFPIFIAHLARKYGPQNVPQGWGLLTINVP